MATYQDFQRLAKMLMGQGAPNPYMGLNLRERMRDGWDNFAQNWLPQAPGMQKQLFPQYDETDPAAYELMLKYYNY